MKRFKEFLSEMAGGNREISDIVFMFLNDYDKNDTMMLRKVLMPMSRTISERLFGKRNRIFAGHITSESNMRELKSMEGTQKSLACMTNPTSKDIWLEGVATHGGIVCIIEGYPTLISNIDLYSRVDAQGRRFIPLNSFFSDNVDIDYEPGYKKMLEQLKDTLFDSILRARATIKDEITFKMADRLGVTPSLQDWLFTGGWQSIDMITRKEMLDAHNIDKRTAGKIKNYAIRRWFDEMEKIWKNNWKKLSYIFDPELMSKRKEGWNEINLVDIKVVECYIIKDVTPLPDDIPPPPPGFDDEWDDDPDTAGVPIAGYIEIISSGEDFSPITTYTADGLRTVKEIESKIRT